MRNPGETPGNLTQRGHWVVTEEGRSKDMAGKRVDPDANVRRVVRLMMARDDVDPATVAKWIGKSRQAVYDRQGPPVGADGGPKARWSVAELNELARRFKVPAGIFFQRVDIYPADVATDNGIRNNWYSYGNGGIVTGTLAEMLGVPA